MHPIESVPGGVRLLVLVQPRASRTEVVGTHGDAIRIRLAAPPVDGAANEELIRFLARRLGVGRRAVDITGGLSSRRKVVQVAGATVEQAMSLLEAGG